MHRLTLAALLSLICALATPSPARAATQYERCAAGIPFADCTQVQCPPGPDNTYTCRCPVRNTVESAMVKDTQHPENNCLGEQNGYYQSRFAAVKYVQLCSPKYQKEPFSLWAWCLAVSCKDNHDGSADCPCIAQTAVRPPTPTFPYVVVMPAREYDETLCTFPPNPISSATQEEAFGIQYFLNRSVPVITNPRGRR